MCLWCWIQLKKKSLHMCLVMADGLWKDECISLCWSFCFQKIDSFTYLLEFFEASFVNTGQSFFFKKMDSSVLFWTPWDERTGYVLLWQPPWKVMGVQHSSVSHAGHPGTKCLLENLNFAGKEEKSKNYFWGHISVSGRNIQEKKAFCTATRWKALLFANSLFF